jgi:3-oxoacyl-[acyl-carrier protein] reductase
MSDSTPVILVTGGSRGLGRGICLKLSESGYSVIINFVGNAKVAECQDRKTRRGQKFIALRADIGKKDDGLIAEGIVPQLRWGTAEDVALAAATLLDGSFPFSTGSVIDIDGGFHIKRL